MLERTSTALNYKVWTSQYQPMDVLAASPHTICNVAVHQMGENEALLVLP
jgi:hypothetical protein